MAMFTTLGSCDLKLWQYRSGRMDEPFLLLNTPSMNLIRRCLFNYDGSKLILQSSDWNTHHLTVVDLTSWQNRTLIGLESMHQKIMVSGVGNKVAAFNPGPSASLVVWDLDIGGEAPAFCISLANSILASLSPDFLVVVHGDGIVMNAHEISSNGRMSTKPVATLNRLENGIIDVTTFNVNGTMFAAAQRNGVSLWNVSTSPASDGGWQPHVRWNTFDPNKECTPDVESMEFNNAGTALMIGYLGHGVRIWSTATGMLVGVVTVAYNEENFGGGVFVEDEIVVVARDDSLLLYRIDGTAVTTTVQNEDEQQMVQEQQCGKRGADVPFVFVAGSFCPQHVLM